MAICNCGAVAGFHMHADSLPDASGGYTVTLPSGPHRMADPITRDRLDALEGQVKALTEQVGALSKRPHESAACRAITFLRAHVALSQSGIDSVIAILEGRE